MADKYTKKIGTLQYVPTDIKATITDCIDSSKYVELKRNILASNAPPRYAKVLIDGGNKTY